MVFLFKFNMPETKNTHMNVHRLTDCTVNQKNKNIHIKPYSTTHTHRIR